MSLRFLDEAAAELVAAIGHYADESLELAIDFDKTVDERLEMATKMPAAGRRDPRAPERFELRWYDEALCVPGAPRCSPWA